MIADIMLLPALIPLALICLLLPLGLLATVFWIWMLISAAQNKGLDEGEKIAWVLIVALLHFIGALIYFFIGHPKRNTPRATT
ncbi:MAG TPA: PLD nuclease N-terminal domain-containing protein [Methylomirabilota bacterium]|nr:PLD nuclease N-terminal domain-containing protein [Methylomirabilota bacterium]